MYALRKAGIIINTAITIMKRKERREREKEELNLFLLQPFLLENHKLIFN